MPYALRKADPSFFAVCAALYRPPREPLTWEEVLAPSAEGEAFFLYDGETRIGGARRVARGFTDAFLCPPFADRRTFWKALLSLAGIEGPDQALSLWDVDVPDVPVLLDLGGQVVWAQRRMFRPTEALPCSPLPGLALRPPRPEDLETAARVAWAAHGAGYTASVRPMDLAGHRQALARRFTAFEQTGTLGLGAIAWDEATGGMAGIAIAGVYPDTRSGFSTLHQLSVLPENQGRGIGAALLARVLTNAVPTSPVMTLGVMEGNPAARLYARMGFAPGPAYTEMSIEIK